MTAKREVKPKKKKQIVIVLKFQTDLEYLDVPDLLERLDTPGGCGQVVSFREATGPE